MLRLFAILISAWLLCLHLNAQSNFENGMNWYAQRAEGSVGLVAKSNPIELAIYFFKKALSDVGRERESGILLMRCFYFKGCFVAKDETAKSKVFEEGYQLGEKLAAKYPNCPATQFWYSACLGKWAEVKGGWAAAKEGVADKMKDAADRIISLDPRYWDAAGYRTLGLLHIRCPFIPFVLNWPDNDDGLAALRKSVEWFPNNPGNLVSYAEALHAFGKDTEARNALKKVLSIPPRPELYLEDLKEIEDARALLKEYGGN